MTSGYETNYHHHQQYITRLCAVDSRRVAEQYFFTDPDSGQAAKVAKASVLAGAYFVALLILISHANTSRERRVHFSRFRGDETIYRRSSVCFLSSDITKYGKSRLVTLRYFVTYVTTLVRFGLFEGQKFACLRPKFGGGMDRPLVERHGSSQHSTRLHCLSPQTDEGDCLEGEDNRTAVLRTIDT